MDIERLLSKEVQDFIQQHIAADVKKLALTKHSFESDIWKEILVQIQSRQKAKTKLPTWYQLENILFPSAVSVEQTSSESLAAYKAKQLKGASIIDLTGGFGVDAYYFSQHFDQVTHCEWNAYLSKIVVHNFKILERDNIDCISGDSTEILKNLDIKFDWIYIDPARRDDQQKKVFRLDDCTPNVVDQLDFYFEYANNILIKTAPLLDISLGFEELKNVQKIEIISLHNEVKEVLWFLQKDFEGTPEVIATDIDKNGHFFHFETQLTDIPEVHYSLPLQYLYQPLNGMLKTGNFNHIASTFDLYKLEKHTHLYTSNNLKDFPGRIFEIKEVVPFNKQEIKKRLSKQKAHLSTRNFPLKPEELRKKFDIKDGGDFYIFFTMLLNQEKVMLFCEKV